MTERQIAAWLDQIELDVADVATADDSWYLRQLVRREVYLVRGLPPQPWPHPFVHPPGLISE